MSNPWRGLAASVVTLVVACARYELRSAPCPAPVLPRPRSAVAWEAAAGFAGVAGRVVRVAERDVLPAALVEVRPVGRDGPRSAQPTDSAGRFAFRDLPPGRYTLGVASLGYFRAVDTVRVTPDSGATVLVALARDVLVLDGCGYAQVRVRRPWWKGW